MDDDAIEAVVYQDEQIASGGPASIMSSLTPHAAINRLVAALRDHNLEAAVSLYEEDATMIVYPGMLAKGTASIRTFFEGLFRLKPDIEYDLKHFVEAGDLALFTGKWTLSGPIPQSLQISRTNNSAVILRKQPDGNWRIAVDNPWGASAQT